MVSSTTVLKDMNSLASKEGGTVKDIVTAQTLFTCLQTTTFRLIKQGSSRYRQIANEIYGTVFMKDINEATLSTNGIHFSSMVRQFCKDAEMPMPKSTHLLQYVAEYVVQRAFVRPITQSPQQVNDLNEVPLTNAAIQHLNEIYGLAGLPFFCNSVTGMTPKETKFSTKSKSVTKMDDFHRSATVFVQKH